MARRRKASRSLSLTSDFQPDRGAPCFCGSGEQFQTCCGSRKPDRPPPYGVGIVPAFLDVKTCNEWIAYLRQQPRAPLGTVESLDSGVSHAATIYDEDRITDVVKAGTLRAGINRAIERAYRDVIGPHCKRRFAWFEYPQVLRYEPGGWYRAHADSELCMSDGKAWAKGIDRDSSLLLYLNDDFDGGELNFLKFHYSYRPQAGDLVFFPSDHRYVHQAQPVKSDLRWVVVSWAAFTDEPRVRDAPAPASIML